MKVYVVEWEYDDKLSDIDSIWTSKRKAEARVLEIENKGHWAGVSVAITVNKPSDIPNEEWSTW